MKYDFTDNPQEESSESSAERKKEAAAGDMGDAHVDEAGVRASMAAAHAAHGKKDHGASLQGSMNDHAKNCPYCNQDSFKTPMGAPRQA